jgi:hypothetical protein
VDIAILGIREMKWIGSGHFRSANNTMLYSGHSTHKKNGVGMIITNQMSQSLIGYKAVNDRIIYIREGTPGKYNLGTGVRSYNQCGNSGHRRFLRKPTLDFKRDTEKRCTHNHGGLERQNRQRVRTRDSTKTWAWKQK